MVEKLQENRGEENVGIGEDEGFLDYGFWVCVGTIEKPNLCGGLLYVR